MRVEEQGLPVTIVKPEMENKVVQRRGERQGLTLQDLKVPVESTKATAEKEPAPTEESLSSAVENANKLMSIASYHMQFKIDEHSERVQVTLIDDRSDEVIRQIPADQMLELSAKIKEMLDTFQKMVGVFVDEIG